MDTPALRRGGIAYMFIILRFLFDSYSIFGDW